jgi:hypothetical protein
MSGKITLLPGENMTLSTGSVLAVFQTAAVNSLAAQVKIKRIEIGQSGTTTLAMIRGEVFTRDTAGTLTVTSKAPVNVRPVAGPASGLAGNTSVIGGVGRSGINSSADSGGAYTQIMPFNFPNTAGYLFKPEPDEEIWIPPSTVAGVRFLAAPGTLTGWTIQLWLVEE